MSANLRDERSFPALPHCPHDNDVDSSFFELTRNCIFRPSRHWCLLADIIDERHFPYLQLFARDKLGVEFLIAFNPRDGNRGLDPTLFPVGHTIAIMYAQQHNFFGLPVGVLQEVIRGVKVCIAEPAASPSLGFLSL